MNWSQRSGTSAVQSVKILVIGGTGETFCAGDDITEMPAWGNANQIVRRARRYQGMANTLEALDKVTIAAVDGYASAAASRSRWPATSSSPRARQLGDARGRRRHNARLGRHHPPLPADRPAHDEGGQPAGALYPARRAVELGLWNRVVGDDRLAPEVEALIEVVLSKNQQAARQLKFIIDSGVEADQYTAQGFEALPPGLSGAVNEPGGPHADWARHRQLRTEGKLWRRRRIRQVSGRIHPSPQGPTYRRVEGVRVSVERYDSVVGAGAAGLGVAAELARRKMNPFVLERSEAVGSSWRARYPKLRLNNDRWSSRLPRSSIRRRAGRWPARDEFIAYLEATRRPSTSASASRSNASTRSPTAGRFRPRTDRRLPVRRRLLRP